MSVDYWALSVTAFSPKGRLHQVECALKAIERQQHDMISVAAVGDKCGALVTKKFLTDKLIDPDSVTNIHPITSSIGCLTTGPIADCQSQVRIARIEALKFQHKYSYEIPAYVLCKRMADLNQVHTQMVDVRSLASTMHFMGNDDGDGDAYIYQADPTGNMRKFVAFIPGAPEAQQRKFMNQYYKEKMDEKGCIEFALEYFTQKGETLKAEDFEIGLLCMRDAKTSVFRFLRPQEIEKYIQEFI